LSMTSVCSACGSEEDEDGGNSWEDPRSLRRRGSVAETWDWEVADGCDVEGTTCSGCD
jgi:hypothetical protein